MAASFFCASAADLNQGKLTAGIFTTPEYGANAFSIPVAALSHADIAAFANGRARFNEAWVVAPDPGGVWGLGPTFNEDRCSACHANNGRAKAPADGHSADLGTIVQLSVAGHTSEGAPKPHPVYGDQLQNRGTPGRVPAEGQITVFYSERELALGDGATVRLRAPHLRFTELAFGDLGLDTLVSARIAPAMIGLGLLEAVPEETIVAISRQQPPAIRGKPNYVWNYETGQTALGRFGWKASQPSVRQQAAAAFSADIGATSSLFPADNCPPAQHQCLTVPSASRCSGQRSCNAKRYTEVTGDRLREITQYLQMLAVPARRNVEELEVQRGETLFTRAQCGVCHSPTLRTGDSPGLSLAVNITFHPYTDLLLHDMGEALADGRPHYLANGREWRTAPLWSLGLLSTVNGHMNLLHDGRARDVTEAILWHGGQAASSRDVFRSMTKDERAALVKFVESL